MTNLLLRIRLAAAPDFLPGPDDQGEQAGHRQNCGCPRTPVCCVPRTARRRGCLRIASARVRACTAATTATAVLLAVVLCSPRCLAASLPRCGRSDSPDRPLQDDPPALRIWPRDPRVARPVERSGRLHVVEGAQCGRKPNTHHVLGERLGQVLPVRGDQTEPVQLLFGRFL